MRLEIQHLGIGLVPASSPATTAPTRRRTCLEASGRLQDFFVQPGGEWFFHDRGSHVDSPIYLIALSIASI